MTTKMTRAEFTRAIAEKREPMPTDIPGYVNDVSPFREWAYRHTGTIAGFAWEPHKRYLTDANAAFELLEELPKPAIIKEHNNLWCAVIDDSPPFLGPQHSNLKITICLAWFKWAKGVTVELTD